MTSKRKQRLSIAAQRRIEHLVSIAPPLTAVQQATIAAAFATLHQPEAQKSDAA
jgi:hypothetical protein